VYAGGVAAFIIILLLIIGVCIYRRRKRHQTLEISNVKTITATANPLYLELDSLKVPDASSKDAYTTTCS
jgi:hypothetical protein